MLAIIEECGSELMRFASLRKKFAAFGAAVYQLLGSSLMHVHPQKPPD
jgi:hypothetical protein